MAYGKKKTPMKKTTSANPNKGLRKVRRAIKSKIASSGKSNNPKAQKRLAKVTSGIKDNKADKASGMDMKKRVKDVAPKAAKAMKRKRMKK